jgi:hypothetical protein
MVCEQKQDISSAGRHFAATADSLVADRVGDVLRRGGLNHAHDIWQGGWLPYEDAPLPINAFWTALAGLDLLAAGLLLWCSSGEPA